MDVRCERCGTEYEFEDDRVTEEGVTVKCSTCGHLFKIRKKSFVLTEPVVLGKKDEGEGGRNWMVRKGDGTVLTFKELTTLQKWIVERKVSRDDEISRSGESWKRLGEITELASFFQVVDQATAAATAAPAGAQLPGASPTQPLPAATPAASVTQPLPAAVEPAVSTPAAPVAAPAPAASVSEPPPATPVQPAAPVQPAPPVTTGPAPATEPSSPGQPALAAEQAFMGGGQLEPDSWGEGAAGDDDDVIEKWKRRSRRKWYFLVPLLLVLTGLGAWYLAAPGSFMDTFHRLVGRQEIPPAASQAYQQGLASLKGDSQADFAAAAKLLDDAIRRADGKYPQALAALSLLHTEQADHAQAEIARLDGKIAELQKREDELKPRDGSQPQGELFDKIAAVHNQKVDLQKQHLRLVDQARKELVEAKRLVDDARRLDANSVEAAIALADYYRVMSGERAHVEKVLQPARRQAPQNPWLLYVDGASLAGMAGQAGAAAARLRQALAADAGLVAARLKLARLLLAQKQEDAARAELKTILAQKPSHRQAQALLASLEQRQQPPEEKKKETPAQPGEPTTYQGWLKLASRQLDAGATRKALASYDRALKLRSDGAAALAGKGLCYLDAGSNAAAILWFGKALKADPRNADALMGMAEAQKYQGNTGKARHYYQRYLELHPQGPDAAVARRNLKEL